MHSDNFRDYLHDLGFLLREKALEAKLERETAVGSEYEDLKLGWLMAYYEVLSLARDQAAAFDIDLESLGLDGFDPERDLL